MVNKISDTAHQDKPVSPKSRRNRLGLIAGATAATLSVLIYGFTALSPTFAADRVLNRGELRLATVERGDLVREVMAQGRIIVANSPTLFSPGQGTVGLRVRAGGAVKGGDIYGSMPDLNLEGDSDIGEGRIIPSTSIDQYGANLASWFGLPSADFGSVFPNLHNFDAIDLGFMTSLHRGCALE